MSQTALDFLFRIEPPWIYVGPGESERLTRISPFFYSREDRSVCVRRLRGHKMRTYDALMNEFAAALQFFDGFGENWPALEECLAYLDEWLPADAYVLVVERSEELLKDEGRQALATFLKIAHRTGGFWAQPIADGDRFDRPARPFHVLLHLSPGASVADTDIVKTAREAGIPVRMH